MYIEAPNHSDRLDAVLNGTAGTIPHGRLFDTVLNLMPSGLSDPVKIFGAIIISALVAYGTYYAWRDTFWRGGSWRD